MLVDTISILPGSSDTVGGIQREKTLTMPGELATTAGSARWYVPVSMRITSIEARVAQAPTGGPVRLAVKKNGVRVTDVDTEIAPDTSAVTVLPVSLLDSDAGQGDYFTVDLLQAGAIVKGSNLTVQVNYVTTTG